MNKSIQRFSLRNLIAFSTIVIIIIALSSKIIISCYPDLINLFFSPSELDFTRAIAENPLIDLENMGNKDKSEIQKAFEEVGLGSLFRLNHSRQYKYNYKYNQNNKYEFSVTPDKIYDLGLGYETNLIVDFIKIPLGATHKYVLFQKNDMKFFAKVAYDLELSDNKTYKGTFIPISESTIHDISEVLYGFDSINNLFIYEFDTTINLLPEQISSFIFSTVLLGVVLWLSVKLILQIVFCNKRPLYKKIDILNGDVDSINEQLKTAKFNNGRYITKDWIIMPTLFKTYIKRNINNI